MDIPHTARARPRSQSRQTPGAPLRRAARGLSLGLALLVGCEQGAVLLKDQGDLGAHPARVGDRLYFTATRFGITFAALGVDLKAERIDWIQPAAGFEPCQDLSADEGGVFVLCGALLSALDPATGAVTWRVELPGTPAAPPLLLKDRLIIALDGSPGPIRSAGPGHGGVVTTTDEDAVLYSPGANPDAYVWRWMVDLPHAFAWSWMNMEEPRPAPEGLPPPEGEALERAAAAETPSPVADLGPPPSFLGGASEPSPSPAPSPPPELGRALVLDKSRGLLLTEVSGDADAPMATFGGTLVWARGASILGLSPVDGQVLWRQPREPGLLALMAQGDRLLVVQKGQVRALDGGGSVLWSAPTRGWTTPVFGGDRILYLEAGALKARALADGALLWEAPAVGVVDRPVVGGDWVILKTVGGELLALSLKSGAPLWRREVGARGRILLGEESLFWIAKEGLVALPVDGEGDPEILEMPGGGPESWAGERLEDAAPQGVPEGIVLRLDGGRLVRISP